jgi:hypothetical protein
MEQSRQTPRVRSDAIRGSEILANWVKLGCCAELCYRTTVHTCSGNTKHRDGFMRCAAFMRHH